MYLPGYDHDIFVSYVHEAKLGEWTEGLRDELGKALNLLLELRPPASLVDVWIDDRLRKNLPLDDELRCRVESSALLLVVMSPFYVRSEWCGRETAWFVDAAGARGAPDGGVFVVQAYPTDRDKWPKALARLPGYPFFARHPTVQQDLPLGLIGDKDDEVAFKMALWSLAGQIKAQFDELQKRHASAQQQKAASIPDSSAATRIAPRLVCLETLGVVSPAATDAEQELRRALRDRNVKVFAPSELGGVPTDPVEAERYLQRLTKAKASCDGLVLMRFDPALPVAGWVFDYLCDIRPMARSTRSDKPDPLLLVVDVGSGDPAPVPSEIQLLRHGDPQRDTQLDAWVGSLPAARGESRQ